MLNREEIMAKVEAELLNSNKTIRQICADTESIDQRVIYKYFSDKYGMTPHQFRKQHIGTDGRETINMDDKARAIFDKTLDLCQYSDLSTLAAAARCGVSVTAINKTYLAVYGCTYDGLRRKFSSEQRIYPGEGSPWESEIFCSLEILRPKAYIAPYQESVADVRNLIIDSYQLNEVQIQPRGSFIPGPKYSVVKVSELPDSKSAKMPMKGIGIYHVPDKEFQFKLFLDTANDRLHVICDDRAFRVYLIGTLKGHVINK